MAEVSKSSTALRILGEELEPDEISRLMQCQPDVAYKRGDTLTTSTGSERVASFGLWSISVKDRIPADLEAQVRELIRPEVDLSTWLEISARFRVGVFCGLFLSGGNEGLSLSAATLKLLSDREIGLDFDIYPLPSASA